MNLKAKLENFDCERVTFLQVLAMATIDSSVLLPNNMGAALAQIKVESLFAKHRK